MRMNCVIVNLRSASVKSKSLMRLQIASNCWICEGWSQVEFKVMPKSQNVPNLHLNFENFKAQKMDEDPEYKGSYRLFRMIPPGPL